MTDESAIRISPSEKLKEFLHEHLQNMDDAPERIKLISYSSVPVRKRGGKSALSLPDPSSGAFLCVADLNWLYAQVKKLRDNGNQSSGVYLHKLLEGCEITLPQPPILERDPELEARIQRLKKEQEAKQYRAMTKNVDNVRIHHPDDSIGYQIKMINSHIIAVVQFIVSVGAGFTFGFIGIQLMVGSLDFGFRLLLGVACALTIALAEIYFLAKKLSEDYEDALPIQPLKTDVKQRIVPSVSGKQHTD